jgi:rubredoxin
MSAPIPLQALKNGDSLDFWRNYSPKCPHCGHLYDMSVQEDYSLLNTLHDEISSIECPECELIYTVRTTIKYSFSTDKQVEE